MSSVADIVELEEERSKRVPLTDSEFSTAGAMLKAAREALGHSIEDAHDATNVRPDYLEAIEEMDIGRLPIAAYTSGFVKAYAQFLELPDEALVARFRKEAGYEKAAVIAPEIPHREQRELAGGKELSLLAVAGILFFVIWVAFQITRPAQDDGPVQPVALEGTPLQQRPIEGAESTFETANETPATSSDTPATINVPEQTAPETAAEITQVQDAAAETESALIPQDIADEPVPAETSLADEDALTEPEPQPVTNDAVDEAETLNAAQIDEPVAAPLPEEPTEIPVAETFQAEETEPVSDLPQLEQFETVELPETQLPVIETPVPVEAVVTEPTRLRMVPPVYPIRCQRRADDIERVTVLFDVDSQGRPVNQRVSRSSNPCFDQSSLNAIDRWTFEPATRNGAPVPAYGQSTTFVYSLPD